MAFQKGNRLGGRPKGIPNNTKIPRCVKFMSQKGWKELEWLALYRGVRGQGTRNQIPALELLVHYGYGKPVENKTGLDTEELKTLADFLSSAKDPSQSAKPVVIETTIEPAPAITPPATPNQGHQPTA